jgi:mannose-1-phosphate guanylyltransferase
VVWESNANGNLDLLSMDIPSISIDYAVMERSKKIKWYPHNLTGLIWVLLNRFMIIWLALAIQSMKMWYGSGTIQLYGLYGDTIFVYTYSQLNFEKIFTGCQSVYTYGDNSDLLN